MIPALATLALLLQPVTAGTQTMPDSLPAPPAAMIDTVLLSGNETTKDYVIINEMSLHPGMPAAPEAMAYDRNRIYSLGLFTRVDLTLESLADGRTALRVDVNERWYLIPLPLFGFRDGDLKKVYFGAGLLHNNLGGKNQKLFVSGVLGYNPSFGLSFSDPLLVPGENLSLGAALNLSRIRNRSEAEASIGGDFDEHHYNIGLTLGKRLSLFHSVSLSVGWMIVQIDEYRQGRTVSTDGRDAFLSITLNYTYDSRDLREYPSQGLLVSGGATKNGFGESPVNFARYGLDVRSYTLLDGWLTLGARVAGSVVSGGEIPTYARSYFGYGERIRGYYTTVFEGENFLLGTVEARFMLLPLRDIRFTAITLPQEFSIWRFGVGFALFADAGTVWFRGDPLQWSSFASGYGASVNWLLPYSVVVRTAYAINDLGRGQFVLDLRLAF